MFKVFEVAPRFVYHEVSDTEAKVHVKHDFAGEHCVSTSFSDVAGSVTALNTGAVVLSADVGVEGLELLRGQPPGLLLLRRQPLKWHCGCPCSVSDREGMYDARL